MIEVVSSAVEQNWVYNVIKDMTLKQAVKEVIEQNKTAHGYWPTRFIQMTENGEAKNLEGIISRLVSGPPKINTIIENLEKYKWEPILIEEFIAMYGFGLSNGVIREARLRTEAIQKLRWSSQQN